MRSLFPQKYHHYIYIFALSLLVIGLPLSKFLLSLSQIILVCNWILEGDLKNKFLSFFKNKAALAASSLLFLHIIGLLYTSDFDYAFKDIRIKVPLLVLPLILSTSDEIALKWKHLIIKLLIAALLISTVISSLILGGVIHKVVADVRYASVFISHVRLALLIAVAVISCIYLIRHPEEKKFCWLHVLIACWFLIFLIMIESITGIIALSMAGSVLLLWKASCMKNRVLKYSLFLIMGTLFFVTGHFIHSTYKRYATVDHIDPAKLEKFTAKGNPYQHTGINTGPTENGHYVWIYFCEQELKEEWNKRSKFDYNWRGMRGDVIRFTLARFLTSKNLRKDAEGMSHLSDKEIRAIEKGIANVEYMSKVKGRISEIIWEIQTYQNTGDANGHSISQRFEFWKAAVSIISRNPVIGVGTGDIQKAFDEEYERRDSPLGKAWRLRSHNQYLSITVAFGFIGLIWFLFSLIYPPLKLNAFSSMLYVSFFTIAAISFLSEDTLETQVGVTFYAFLNAFFLFVMKENESKSEGIV
ncbi:MAG: Lipid core - O-antigen ligase [Bacteroidota bacterium]|jgi:hypothetical protein|nr:Lipid core - O-antigen ligase [Bacteroidota bacterium]